jgi:hypothetical protein
LILPRRPFFVQAKDEWERHLPLDTLLYCIFLGVSGLIIGYVGHTFSAEIAVHFNRRKGYRCIAEFELLLPHN